MSPRGPRPGNRLLMLSPAPLVRGVRLIWQSAPGWTVVQISLLVLQGLVPLLTLYLTKLIVDGVGDALTSGAGVGALGGIGVLIAAAGAVSVAGVGIRTLSTLVNEVQSLRLGDQVHDVLHSKSIEVDLEYYESTEYHNTLHRAQEEAPYRPGRIVSEVAQVGQNALSLLAVTGLLISFHWLLTLVLFVAAVPGVLIRVRFSRRMYDWALRQTPATRKSRYINTLLTSAAYAKEIRLFGLGEILRTRFRELRDAVRTEKLKLVRRRSGAEMLAQASALAAVFGAFAFIARDALGGGITIGDMVMYFGAFQRGQDFFGGMLGALAGLYEDNLFLTDLETFLELEPRVAEPATPRPIPRPVRDGIALENVSFRYPGDERVVLEDVSLHIRPGEHIALVGENGSGKTTLVKLLCRLYDPDSGSIRIDGHDLRDFRTADLRREIGIIFQDYARYHLTARENINFGNVDVAPDDPRILDAAVRTGADPVIRRLPREYETTLGRQFDDGAELSIGEWQKVALARAFLRDSQIIVLDEPTASLDARSEAEVFAHFHELARDRTAVLISHRLSTVRMVDRIFVLAGGRIIETGTHDDLVSLGGTYARLFELQAQYYR
jgi:ATP-binding cassette, subfamily B, bacterial